MFVSRKATLGSLILVCGCINPCIRTTAMLKRIAIALLVLCALLGSAQDAKANYHSTYSYYAYQYLNTARAYGYNEGRNYGSYGDYYANLAYSAAYNSYTYGDYYGYQWDYYAYYYGYNSYLNFYYSYTYGGSYYAYLYSYYGYYYAYQAYQGS